MPQVASLPGTKSGKFNRWGANPLEDLDLFLRELAFTPSGVELWFQGNFYPVAQLLGLKVPFQAETGNLEPIPGYVVSYTWGSTDGRSTDYLTLSGAYNEDALRALLSNVCTIMTLEYRRDLEVVVMQVSRTPPVVGP